MVICLERGGLAYVPADATVLSVSCLSKIQIGFTILVLAHPGSPGQRAIKRVCVCACVLPISNTTTLPCWLFCRTSPRAVAVSRVLPPSVPPAVVAHPPRDVDELGRRPPTLTLTAGDIDHATRQSPRRPPPHTTATIDATN